MLSPASPARVSTRACDPSDETVVAYFYEYRRGGGNKLPIQASDSCGFPLEIFLEQQLVFFFRRAHLVHPSLMVAPHKERKVHPAAQCVRIDLQHPNGMQVARRKVTGGSSRPIVKKQQWNDIPGWIALYAERGSKKKCWNGCCLERAKQDGRTYDGCQIRGCDWRPPAGAPIWACTKCKWSVCERCADRPRMPTLAQDPLFHGPDDPCLLMYPQFEGQVGRGTVIVCPGGNYEFLSPLEGLPVVEWLAQQGIGAVVLRYRLLPDYGMEDCLDDLEAAVARVRGLRPGPVAALGFSAGGHLIASLGIRAQRQGKRQPLDAQVLVYPGIDGKDWYHPDYNGFFTKGRWRIPRRAESLHAYQDDLLGGESFAAPATCLVGSTDDSCTPNEEHTDIYHASLERLKIPNAYLRDSFGEHGFELQGGWTPGCVKWLHSQGFGGPKSMPGVHGMSLRRPAPRAPLDENQLPQAEPMAGEPGSSMDCDENYQCFPPPPAKAAARPGGLREREEEMAAAKAIAKNMNIGHLGLVDFACTPAPQVSAPPCACSRNASKLPPCQQDLAAILCMLASCSYSSSCVLRTQGAHAQMGKDLGLGFGSMMPPSSLSSSNFTDATLPTDSHRVAATPGGSHFAVPPVPRFGLGATSSFAVPSFQAQRKKPLVPQSSIKEGKAVQPLVKESKRRAIEKPDAPHGNKMLKTSTKQQLPKQPAATPRPMATHPQQLRGVTTHSQQQQQQQPAASTHVLPGGTAVFGLNRVLLPRPGGTVMLDNSSEHSDASPETGPGGGGTPIEV